LDGGTAPITLRAMRRAFLAASERVFFPIEDRS
jgi:hypothetical protein